MDTFMHVPPGFRFHPTDEELVDYYLRKKVVSKRIELDVIKEVDLYRIEPWDLQGIDSKWKIRINCSLICNFHAELCRIGTEEQSEWYFFSHKDKKYPTGTRTNRATKAGFWKATGRDKAIYSRNSLIGMRKTLVFYKGRAPNGQKSDWIMHEYRLETNENGSHSSLSYHRLPYRLEPNESSPPQEEGWVVCRVFKKRLPTMRKPGDYDSPSCWYDDSVPYIAPDLDSPMQIGQTYPPFYHHYYPCKQELEFPHNLPQESTFFQLPQLESPKAVHHSSDSSYPTSVAPFGYDMISAVAFPLPGGTQEEMAALCDGYNNEQTVENLTDWRVLDKFVASQLSNEMDASKVGSCSNSIPSHDSESLAH